MAEVTTMQDAAVLYRKVEARLEAKKDEYEKACAKDKKALESLELIMLQMLHAEGVRVMDVPGVAEVKIVDKRVFGCADWDLLFTWIVTNNKPEILQKRIHEANITTLINDMKGELPPAINVHTVAEVKVLKSKAK